MSIACSKASSSWLSLPALPWRCLVLAISTFLGFGTLLPSQNVPVPPVSADRYNGVGNSPEDPGPRASRLSSAMKPVEVKAAMRKVADWQLARLQHKFSQDWTFATLYVGMLSASDTLQDPRYQEYVLGIANHYDWTLGPRKSHADDQAIGQAYLQLNSAYPNAVHIARLRSQFDELMRQPDDPKQPVWWWCDALFMAPPVWADLAAVTHQDKYLAYMDREWHITSDLLWDPEEHLFSRDSSFLNRHETNGKKIFWSRGNGWVMGGLVRVLTVLPPDDPRRPFYLEIFRQMAEKVRAIQSGDGLWRPGLLDEADYPYPETSGSSFFVYALAWGIRSKILARTLYLPVVESGWKGLVEQIYADGRLGNIQPIGAAPDGYNPESSYVFGIGAFLLAGSQVELLSH